MSLWFSHHIHSLIHRTHFHPPPFLESVLKKVTIDHDIENSVTVPLLVISFFVPSVASSIQLTLGRNFSSTLDTHLLFSPLLVIFPNFLLRKFLLEEMQLFLPSVRVSIISSLDYCKNLPSYSHANL